MLDAYGSSYISDVIEGIDWAVQNNMDVISMSLGTATYSQALNDTAANAYNAGIILVAAAGNSGDGNLSTDDVLYPPQEIREALAHNAIDLGDAGRDRVYGIGLVQAG
ncbi:MAG: S8 family serine peptidase [Candidatus Methanoperedens sp.]